MITTQSDLLFLRANEGESQNKAGTVSQLTTSTECVILATKAMPAPKIANGDLRDELSSWWNPISLFLGGSTALDLVKNQIYVIL